MSSITALPWNKSKYKQLRVLSIICMWGPHDCLQKYFSMKGTHMTSLHDEVGEKI